MPTTLLPVYDGWLVPHRQRQRHRILRSKGDAGKRHLISGLVIDALMQASHNVAASFLSEGGANSPRRSVFSLSEVDAVSRALTTSHTSPLGNTSLTVSKMHIFVPFRWYSGRIHGHEPCRLIDSPNESLLCTHTSTLLLHTFLFLLSTSTDYIIPVLS